MDSFEGIDVQAANKYYDAVEDRYNGVENNYKPTVKCKLVGTPVVGKSAKVIPFTHVSAFVINGELATTSAVVSYDKEAGIVETRNTVYVVVED